MAFKELYFTFSRRLDRQEEDIFIGHLLAVRDSQILAKVARLKAASALQAKVPFNPAKPVLEGYVMQCQMIEDHINEYFVLEPVESDFNIQTEDKGKYVLRLSEALNMGKVDKVTKIVLALSDKQWIENLLREVKVKSVQVGGVP